MPGLYDHQRYCELAGAEIRRFAADVRGADPSTPVPTCGDWTLRDLIHHAGPIHRWTAGTVAVCAAEQHRHTATDQVVVAALEDVDQLGLVEPSVVFE